MLVKVYGSALVGVEALPITLEIDVANGIGYHLVGLPDNAIKESNYRIASALKNNSFKVPGKRITINLAPADMRKEGSAYDLPIAMGILAASRQISTKDFTNYIMMGELSLDGSLQAIKGGLSIALMAKQLGYTYVVLPKENATEAAVVKGIEVIAVAHITELIKYLDHEESLSPITIDYNAILNAVPENGWLDFSDVKGQEYIKRSMEIAAAGGHNIILIGPPGSGKTMLAKRLPTILPPMSIDEALETTKIHSVTGTNTGLITQRPFRSPHHTISNVALVGGGGYPQPGEISLAHNGVLFLDELPEFKRSVLEVMRQPLEDREVTISRAKYSITYPSSFMLVASMNPSPNGYFRDDSIPNRSSYSETQRYLNKISGPLLDRIDLHIEVAPVPFNELAQQTKCESSLVIRNRVVAARKIQKERFDSFTGIHYNSQMNTKMVNSFCKLETSSFDLLKSAMERLNLSARAYNRILKVSRTIADLEQLSTVKPHHISEAIQYRSLDREGWLG